MRIRLLVVCILSSVVLAKAQTPKREFDVVSIKRNTGGGADTSFDATPGATFSMINGRIISLIRVAYPVESFDVPGAPAWTRREQFDVVAKASGAATRQEVRDMLRAMLANRFQLASHIESREQPVYVLVLTSPKLPGPNALRLTTRDCEALFDAPGTGLPPAPLANGASPCGYSQRGGTITSGGITMREFASVLGGFADRLVLDRTGLTGRFEFRLTSAYAPSRGRADAASDDRASVFTALQEQLGLKLQADRASVETLVIDRIERPTEN